MIHKLVIRGATDLGVAGTASIVVPCRGARSFALVFKSVDADAPVSLGAAEFTMQKDATVQIPVIVTNTSDILATDDNFVDRGVEIGAMITGVTGIPASTRVQRLLSSQSLQMNAAATPGPGVGTATFDGAGWTVAGATVVTESGDAIGAQALNFAASGNGIAGRTRYYVAPAAMGGVFLCAALRMLLTGNATLDIKGLQIDAFFNIEGEHRF